MAEGRSIASVAQEKLDNFLQKFSAEYMLLGDETTPLTWPALLAQLALLQPFWAQIEKRDEDFFRAMVAVSDDARVADALVVYDQWDSERHDLFWRYVQFFLRAAKESLGKN